ncbi:polysaccharide pyruvyl transferase family protein [Neobacillus massiliamazoniensis]|uniref:Polysaccharide pyruvyl transferase YveS n=1 Tax=Neobacillus massiliamazoniensis TaxID=1499688 RepID=A0A0U1NQ78_9BACI|nr:polysaccharide pyruvyl transferase family protein [Neobacillus massiliamazoniensis]CRK80177.1 polysaccharide pyruvyl transferase YveS [Neobacillus massiliamazoniensis]
MLIRSILNNLVKISALRKINKLKKYKEVEKIIYLLSPEHGNLGDQAIAIAIKKFLIDHYKNKEVIEFSYLEYMYIKKRISSISNDGDIIFLHGGGNLGNLYINEENLRRDVIERFEKNKIIIMPQSISFSEDNFGKIEIEKTKKIYNNHKNLYIVCRESKSFETAQSIFPNNNVILSPDSVLYLSDYYNKSPLRSGVLLALRSDKEKVIDDSRVNKLRGILENLEENLVFKDTIINKRVNEKNRIFEFEKILKAFGSSKLVITDRFHGVIFSFITKTPCIVFKSLDHKISEGIKWFNDIDFIYYAENDSENLSNVINNYLNMGNLNVDEKLKMEFINALQKII